MVTDNNMLIDVLIHQELQKPPEKGAPSMARTKREASVPVVETITRYLVGLIMQMVGSIGRDHELPTHARKGNAFH